MSKLTLYEILPALEESIASGSEALFTPGGRSMQPMLHSGKNKVALVRSQLPLKKYDLPLYRRTGGTLVLHRVVSVQNGSYTMRGDNTFEDEPGITGSQIIGVVSRFSRRGKWHTVTGRGYRLYCAFWVGIYPLRLLLHRAWLLVRRGLSLVKRRVLKIK